MLEIAIIFLPYSPKYRKKYMEAAKIIKKNYR